MRREAEAQEDARPDQQGLPEATPASVRAAMFGKGDRKRPAEEPAEDPRVPGGDDDQVEIGAISKGEPFKCGTCSEEFESRNDWFRHLRDEDHLVESDDEDDRDVGLVDSSDSEAGDAVGGNDDFDNDDHCGSVGSRHPSTDDDCRAQNQDQDATEARANSKPRDTLSKHHGRFAGHGNSREHPGARTQRADIKPKYLEWIDVGSGILAKTFVGATRMWTTTKNGANMDEIQTR